MLEPRRASTGLGSGIAVSEVTLRFHFGGVTEIVLRKVLMLEVALERRPSASDRSMRVVAEPAGLPLADPDSEGVMEIE